MRLQRHQAASRPAPRRSPAEHPTAPPQQQRRRCGARPTGADERKQGGARPRFGMAEANCRPRWSPLARPWSNCTFSSPYPVPQEHANAHSPALGHSAHCPEEQLADSSLVHFTVARTEPPGTEGWALPMGFAPAATRPYEHPPAAAAGARGPLPGATSCSMTATFDGSPPRHRQLLDHGSESTPKDPVNSRCTRYLLGDRAQQGQRRRHAMGRSRTEHAASRVSRGTVPRRSLTEPKQKARSGASEVSWHPATAGQYRTARG